MATSIEKLANNLKSECKDVEKLRNIFKYKSEEFLDDKQLNLMTTKGVYPYDYISSYNKLNDTKLPNKKYFYWKLNKCNISNEDSNQAKTVWNRFNCKTLLDYHNYYLKSDVLLLSDIRENFRNVCYNNYK